MSEEATDPWREVLHEAIKANSSGVMVGTQFLNELNYAAARRGLKFPPSNEPGLRFIQLLERYPDLVSILRRPGQDFLVGPTGKSDLLTKAVGTRPYGIRQDLFEAFTTVSSSRLPYYDKVADCVVWKEYQDGQILPPSWVAIKQPTGESETQIRKDFTIGPAMESPAHSRLLDSLKAPSPLQAFGREVKAAGLQREWHCFRTEHLVEKIKRWAKENQIEWRQAWLTEWSTASTWKNKPALINETPNLPGDDPLRVLFSGLEPVDIQRISIPLDIVLKAVASSKKKR